MYPNNPYYFHRCPEEARFGISSKRWKSASQLIRRSHVPLRWRVNGRRRNRSLRRRRNDHNHM